MAGTLALVLSEPEEKPVSTIKDEWPQVSYSRFITFPSLPSTCPSLIPLCKIRRYKKTRGTWLSSRSPSASLQLHNYHSTDHAILTVCFHGKILEEHYVSRLNFTWPQESSQGSRSLFVSYIDALGAIQKFALQFSMVSEAETFINTVKEILKVDSIETEPLNIEIQSQVSLESINRTPSRACEEESSVTTPIQSSYQPQLPLISLNSQIEQEMHMDKTLPNHNCEVNISSSALPPTFTSFLTNCCSYQVQQVVCQPISSEDVDFKSQIARYMEDSSFLELLTKVEKVVSEIGDDLMF